MKIIDSIKNCFIAVCNTAMSLHWGYAANYDVDDHYFKSQRESLRLDLVGHHQST